jgi:acyl-CoA synthetase (AMP-forming)/AMP-acid ligase II
MTAAPEAPTLTFNLADLFEQVAEQVPGRVAIVIGDRRVTYRELDERSTRFANYLLSIGVQPGDTVGINSYNRIEWIEAMFGAYKARAVAINLNYRYVGEELRYVLDDADVSVLVFERGLAPVVNAVQDLVPTLRQTLVLEDGTDEETKIAAVVHSRVDTLTLEDLQAHARDHIAGYKIPRQLHLAETIQRTPAGKPDYRWAKAIFEG